MAIRFPAGDNGCPAVWPVLPAFAIPLQTYGNSEIEEVRLKIHYPENILKSSADTFLKAWDYDVAITIVLSGTHIKLYQVVNFNENLHLPPTLHHGGRYCQRWGAAEGGGPVRPG